MDHECDGWNNYKIAGIGNWDYGYAYTQRFDQDRDLYVVGDMYQNDVVTPAFILLPRSRTKERKRELGYPNVKKQQGEMMQKAKQEWEGYSYGIKTKIPLTPIDQDLYNIPPEFLHLKPKKKVGFFSSCFLLPTCV